MRKYEIKQAFKNLTDAGLPDNELVTCRKYEQCKESLARPRSRVRREAPAQEQAAADKPEALHVPNKEDYS